MAAIFTVQEARYRRFVRCCVPSSDGYFRAESASVEDGSERSQCRWFAPDP
jgi:hypothetical protein